MLKKTIQRTTARASTPVKQQVRWGNLKNYIIHTTAKVDYNFNTWMNDYAFEDLPYTHRDIFFFNETPVRQHRLIEAKIIARLKKEDKIPEKLAPIIDEIFVSPKEEQERLNELFYKVQDLYKREHPRYFEEAPSTPPVDRDTYWALATRVRDAIRMHNLKSRTNTLAGEIMFGGTSGEMVDQIRSEFTEAETSITDADFQAVLVAGLIEGSGGPKVPVRFGRQNPPSSKYPDPATEKANAIRDRMPGFSDSEVALVCAINSMRAGGFSRAYLQKSTAAAGNALCDDAGLKKAALAYANDLELLKTEFPPAFAKYMEMGEPLLWDPKVRDAPQVVGFLQGLEHNPMVGLAGGF